MSARGPYRRHSAPFKLQLCSDIRSGKLGRREAQKTYGLSANLIQMWLTCYARLTEAVLRRPVECGQYASAAYRQALQEFGLIGSVSTLANPYDNAQAESFMKTLKVEEIYLGGL